MIPLSVLDEIESRLFIAEIGVVSTPRRFDAALAGLRPVRELIGHLVTSVEIRQLADHVRAILERETDAAHSHPHDVPLAVYLRALDIAAPPVAIELGEAFKRLPNLWWARFMADRVLSGASRDRRSEHILWNPSGVRVRGVRSALPAEIRKSFPVPPGDGTDVKAKSKGASAIPTSVHLHGDYVYARAIASAP